MAPVTRRVTRSLTARQARGVPDDGQTQAEQPPIPSNLTNIKVARQIPAKKIDKMSPPPGRAPKRRRLEPSKEEGVAEHAGKKGKTSVLKLADSNLTLHYPSRKPRSSARTETRSVLSKADEYEEFPHNMGRVLVSKPHEPTSYVPGVPNKESEVEHEPDNLSKTVKVVEQAETAAKPKQTAKKAKTRKGLLGVSPFPSYTRPTPEDCKEVVRLLSSVHGEVYPPRAIPTPSLTVTGCGEVPSVLDALLRTRLSAATTRHNSGIAFKGLVDTFGVLQEGIGKGSVDWNKVRQADQKEIFKAIKHGGLGDNKSKDIKKILEMVYEENQQRRRDILASSDAAEGSSSKIPLDQNLEVLRAEQEVLSLDHLHMMSDQDAFDALQKYPGIGVKTASCVLLFCLRRPSFAVDTHVHRLCNWLGWLPPPGPMDELVPGAKGAFKGANEEKAFFHLDTRIPNEYKYALHQLLIKHGMQCPRCRAITGHSSAGWDTGCVLEKLLKRTGARKEVVLKEEVDTNGKVVEQSRLTLVEKTVH